MLKNNPQIISSKRAFTLMEVLIVVVILSVVASIALSNLGVLIEKNRAKEGEQTLYIIYTRVQAAKVEHSWKCLAFALHVDVSMPPSENFESPSYNCFGEPPNPPSIPLRIDIMRKGGLYTLTLDTNTTLSPVPITCASATAGLCERLGYALTPPPPGPD